jgi:hypothetical protein
VQEARTQEGKQGERLVPPPLGASAVNKRNIATLRRRAARHDARLWLRTSQDLLGRADPVAQERHDASRADRLCTVATSCVPRAGGEWVIGQQRPVPKPTKPALLTMFW